MLREASSQNSKMLPGKPSLQPWGQWGREMMRKKHLSRCCLKGALTSGGATYLSKPRHRPVSAPAMLVLVLIMKSER